MNQNIAEPHAVIMIPASTYDFIITPYDRGPARPLYRRPYYPRGLSVMIQLANPEHDIFSREVIE
jgi:hypothetical protein